MQISKRLEMVADMVTRGGVVADIGTDHAYIPIYLIENKKAERAIAMDVNEGPLQRAREHILQHALDRLIDTRLSDGLEALEPQEADCVVIAGMGGPLTVRILTQGEGKLGVHTELILQPQSEIEEVRSWTEEHGWEIVREEMIREDGKYYPMMRAIRKIDGAEDEKHLSQVEKKYGRLLLQRRDPVLEAFLRHELILGKRILSALEGQCAEAAAKRRDEVTEEIQMIETALGGF